MIPSPDAAQVGFDHLLARRYTDAGGRDVDLLVGYFERQHQGHELVGYQLSRMLAADSGPPVIASIGPSMRVQERVKMVGGNRYHVMSWYVIGDRMTAEDYAAKWWTAWRSVFDRRSDGCIVVVSARIGPDDSLETSRSRLSRIVSALIAQSRRFAASG
jgi:EpsI family protein